MTISTRTPEGDWHRCPICGQQATTEPSCPGGDSICPSCGHLLWWFRDQLQLPEGVPIFEHQPSSLEWVQLVMELEERFDIPPLSDEEVEQIRTVGDLLRAIAKRVEPLA
jgi:hypothetical protein